MKLYALLIFNKDHTLLYSNYNLNDFSFFYTFTIKSTIEKIAKQTIESNNTKLNSIYQINETFDDIQFAIYASTFNNYSIIITDQQYPPIVALKLLNIITKDGNVNENINQNELNKLFNDYQTPNDKLSLIKQELDETKLILCDSIDKLINRGETLENIIDKTNQLLETTDVFKNKTKEMNRCCPLF